MILKEIERLYDRKDIKTRIMYKKQKNKTMTIWQKRFNKAVSSKRFRVEQTFGTLKRRFKFTKLEKIKKSIFFEN